MFCRLWYFQERLDCWWRRVISIRCLAFTAILCITVAAGACGAINMWYDRDIDAIMRRTRNRPIPAGRIQPDAALGFGVTLAIGSVIVMGLALNIPAAVILAFQSVFTCSSIRSG